MQTGEELQEDSLINGGVRTTYLGLGVQLLAESADKNIPLNMFINKAERAPAGIRIKVFFDHFYSPARVSSS